MTPHVKPMTHDLTQQQIEALDEQDYSMLLAYGDTLTNQPTISTGTGGDILWETEVERFNREAGEQVVQFGKRVRSTVNNGCTPIAHGLHRQGVLEANQWSSW